ncbi:MAG: hypothetical protein ACRC1M_01935, partial [Methanobacteriaceae archaeon]
MSSNSIIKGNILDVCTGDIFPGEIHINNGYIVDVVNLNSVTNDNSQDTNFEGILIPGLIDAH